MTQNIHAETIFAEAIEISSAQERTAFLDRACQGAPGLRQEVEKLVVDYFRAGNFLQKPVVQIASPTIDRPVHGRPGTMIGPYKLLQQIGEGGMGVVYMAEQTEPVQRKVALKLIKPGMDSRQIIARFEAERQALAMMDHVNIARVLDAGTTGGEPSGVSPGRPYFVMELVHGVPITKYCDDNRLTPRQRLELFVPVCQAIQHAHQKGIIHRDIKPSNVMVTLYDGKPVPKVIDFGVAKATEQKLTERTLFTQYGTMVGTLEYMSPEQAEMSALGVDTRSDIYSLGVLLYELLTGSTPLSSKRMKEAAYAEILRMIKEEEPPKPSTRLSDSGEALASISAQRKTEPAKLTKLVKGELDWIVMKCLEKDRNRRYETANGFAADVQRYLADEAVEACPPSTGYRFRKFARRNKTGLLGTAAALFTLLTLVVGLAVSNRMITRERDRKESALQGEQRALVLARQRGDESAKNLVVARESERTARHALYAAQINLAQQSAASADVDRMLELLNSLRPDPGQDDLRGFEWYYLWRLCHSESFTLQEFSAPVRSAVFSPDGKVLATAHGSELKLWTADGGRLLATLKAANSQIRSIAFSPDGALLAVAGGARQGQGEVQLWDVATKKQKLTLPRFDEPVSTVAFSPDGQSLGTATAALIVGHVSTDDRALAVTRGAKSDRVKLWNVASGKAIGSFAGMTESVLSIAFSPDGGFLAAGAVDGQVIVWQSSTLREEGSCPGSGGYVSTVTFSPDGTTLAAGYGDWSHPGQVILWTFPSMKESRVLRGHRGGVTSLAFSPDGKTIVSGSHDRTVCLWQTAGGEPVQTFVGHRHFVSSVAFAPDGRTVASSSWDNSVRLWDAGNGLSGLRSVPASGTGAAFLPDGRTVINDDVVKVIDRAAGTIRPVEKMRSHSDVAVSPDGRLVAVGGVKGKVVVWDSSTLTRLHEFQDDPRNVWSLDFSPDGTTLASAGDNDKVTLRDLSGGRVIRVLEPQGNRVRSIAFSPDRLSLATATWEGAASVQIWDLRTGAARPLEGRGASSMAFSPDGRLLAIARQNLVWLYDAHTWKVRTKITGHSDDVWVVAFSPDSKTLASTSWDGTLRLWSASSAQLLLTFQLNDAVFAAAFSTDGRTLIATAAASGARFWDAADPLYAEEHIDGVRHRLAALRRLGKLQEADQFLRTTLDTYRQRYGEDHVWTARLMVDLVSLLIERADAATYSEAESLLIKGRSVFVRKLVPGHPWRWHAQYVARDLYGTGAMNDALKLANVAAQSAAIQKTIELPPEKAETHQALGVTLAGQKKLDEAIASFRTDLALDQKSALDHYNLGNALRDQRKLDEAIDEYREALRLEPDMTDARNELAAALNSRAWTLATDPDLEQRDPGRAVKLAKEAVEWSAKAADFWNTLGVAHYRAGNFQEAISSLQQFRELRTSDAEWNNPFFLAMAHQQLGNKDEATQWYNRAVDWMERNQANSAMMLRSRAEAAELLGIENKH